MQQQTQPETQEIQNESLPVSSLNAPKIVEQHLLQSSEKGGRLKSVSSQMSSIAQLARYRKQAKFRYYSNMVFAALLIPVLPFFTAIGSGHITNLFTFTLLSACVLVSLSMYSLTWLQLRNLDKSIADFDDVRMIGPLAEAWDAERFAKPRPIIAALCRLLPRLQASDAALLTREQRTCLYNAIRWKAGRAVYQYDRPLTIAILKALEQIGDKEALPYVRRAALSRHKDVRDAANACLPFVVEHAEQHSRSSMYLRPADARTSSQDVLLRASTDMTAEQHTPPEQLLRAHDQE